MTKITRRFMVQGATAAAVLPLAATMASGESHAAEHTVRITNFTFEPANLTISAGDKVTFINEDGAPHTATAKGQFDTGRLNRGQQASLTFPGAGTFAYICAIHPKMTGTITVT